MLVNNRCEFLLLKRLIDNSMCCMQVRSQSKKLTSEEKIKNLKKEEKLLFGKLVENAKEKNKRLKLEKKGVLQQIPPSKIDTEFSWVLSNSKHLSVLTIQKENSCSQNNDTELNCNSDSNAENISKIEENNKNEPKTQCNSTNNVSVNTQLNAIKLDPLSKTTLDGILECSLLEEEKSLSDEWTNDSQIMSISPLKNRACLKYPSVTRILSATMSEEAKAVLENWKARMIDKLGLRGFEIYQAGLLEDGKLLHSTILNHLTQKSYDVPDKIKQSFYSLKEVLENINQVRATESHVIHPKLLYRGIVDCVASYRGNLFLIDWKKSDKAKNSIEAMYDAPLQLASYIGALNADLNYHFQIRKGIIVVAYTNGNKAKIHELDEYSLQYYWKQWLQRLKDYHVACNAR